MDAGAVTTLSKSCGTPVGIARHDQREEVLCRGCKLALVQGAESQFMARLRAEGKSPPRPPKPMSDRQESVLNELIGVLAAAMNEHPV
jgi:hypothetical protein